jgi:hypothetical protein
VDGKLVKNIVRARMRFFDYGLKASAQNDKCRGGDIRAGAKHLFRTER